MDRQDAKDARDGKEPDGLRVALVIDFNVPACSGEFAESSFGPSISRTLALLASWRSLSPGDGPSGRQRLPRRRE
jgi:hypothetical protein